MSRGMACLVKTARGDPSILRGIAENPREIGMRFGLNGREISSLQANNFDGLGSSLGVDRSSRAASHDDAYLS